jgi:hypothetical protein
LHGLRYGIEKFPMLAGLGREVDVYFAAGDVGHLVPARELRDLRRLAICAKHLCALRVEITKLWGMQDMQQVGLNGLRLGGKVC